MKTLTLLMIVTVFFGGLVGCASPAIETYTHTPYQGKGPIVDKVVVNKPFEQAWNDLVRNLAANFFAVDQIDKESRFISINASQDAGGIGRNQDWWLAYASCGTSERKILYKNKERVFTYSTIGTEPYETAYTDQWIYWDEVQPRVTAEIKMNIYMSPLNSNQTEMSVNARYKFVRTLHGDRYTQRNSGEYLFNNKFSDNVGSTITFTTRDPGIHPADVTPPIKCYSTGNFEDAVINLVR